MSYTLICPNQKCLTSFTAHATFYTFKLGETSGQEQSSYQITPPITLQQIFAVHETSDKETINASFMNALWYFKLFQLPCFWLDGLTFNAKLNDHILEFCLKQSVKEQKKIITKKMKKIPGLITPTLTSNHKDATLKSTNTTDEKNDPGEPSLKRCQTFKETSENLDPSLKCRFTPYLYTRMCPLFLDFKNYNRNYDIFSNFCQNIVQIEDNLEAEYLEWLTRHTDLNSQTELGDAGNIALGQFGSHMPSKFQKLKSHHQSAFTFKETGDLNLEKKIMGLGFAKMEIP